MSELPTDRVTLDKPPFSNTGVDCFGPFLIKIGRVEHKRYGVVFTCLVSRAIHLEMMDAMDTDAFVNALRRFLARRGSVEILRSDNGGNFIGAERELREEFDNLVTQKVVDDLATKGITWFFNPRTPPISVACGSARLGQSAASYAPFSVTRP